LTALKQVEIERDFHRDKAALLSEKLSRSEEQSARASHAHTQLELQIAKLREQTRSLSQQNSNLQTLTQPQARATTPARITDTTGSAGSESGQLRKLETDALEMQSKINQV
jgi:hypothetical protein